MYAVWEFFDTWNLCDHFDAMQKKIFFWFWYKYTKIYTQNYLKQYVLIFSVLLLSLNQNVSILTKKYT